MNMFRIWVLGLLVFILAGCSASIDGSKYQQIRLQDKIGGF